MALAIWAYVDRGPAIPAVTAASFRPEFVIEGTDVIVSCQEHQVSLRLTDGTSITFASASDRTAVHLGRWAFVPKGSLTWADVKGTQDLVVVEPSISQ